MRVPGEGSMAPARTSGVDKPNHMRSSKNMVVKGRAPEDPWPQMKKLRMKKTMAMKLG